MMAVDLGKTLAWTMATFEEQAMLADLQGNILKGHGRHATLNLFVKLGTDWTLNRLMMRQLGARATSALDQLHAAETHKALVARGHGARTTPTFVSVLLSRHAYAKLGIAAPTDAAFGAGMAQSDLGDDATKVDRDWPEEPDAMILIAADPDQDRPWSSTAADNMATAITTIVVGMGGAVAHTIAGRAIFKRQENGAQEGIEHFGYVDGRSQPLLLEEDFAGKETDSQWNPRFPLTQVLVPDPAGGELAFGSYFVFRQLEQNVKAFKEAEEKLGEIEDGRGNQLGERAGAMLVGRFEDGTPVVLDGVEKDGNPVPNDFNYDADPDGVRCPLHAHIRKTNPRGEGAKRGPIPDEETERTVIMARRGITYGRRDRIVDPTDRPTGDVGLLFMSYQSSLVGQFEVTQRTWANDPDFVRAADANAVPPVPPTGVDPVIGQPRGELDIPRGWDDAASGAERREFGGHVTFRGGDYFFAPARSTLLSM